MVSYDDWWCRTISPSPPPTSRASPSTTSPPLSHPVTRHTSYVFYLLHKWHILLTTQKMISNYYTSDVFYLLDKCTTQVDLFYLLHKWHTLLTRQVYYTSDVFYLLVYYTSDVFYLLVYYTSDVFYLLVYYTSDVFYLLHKWCIILTTQVMYSTY